MVWASSAIFELAHQRVNGDDQFFLRQLPAGQSSRVSQGVASKTFFDGALKQYHNVHNLSNFSTKESSKKPAGRLFKTAWPTAVGHRARIEFGRISAMTADKRGNRMVPKSITINIE